MSKTALYRHFNADGVLLYVGISLNAVQRLSQHRFGAKWFVQISRVDVEWLDDRASALAAEAIAIAQEDPVWNMARPAVNRLTEIKINEPWESNPVRRQGEELDETLWQGYQWAVTSYGIECRDGCYPIEAERIGEKDWCRHLSEKVWVNMPDFIRALTVGLRIHCGRIARLDSFMVAHVESGCFDGFYARRQHAQDALAEFAADYPAERFLIVGVPEGATFPRGDRSYAFAPYLAPESRWRGVSRHCIHIRTASGAWA